MGKQQRKPDRCFVPAVSGVAQVRFPVGAVKRRQRQPEQTADRKRVASGPDGRLCCGSTNAEEDRGAQGLDGESGELDMKRTRLDRLEEAAALTSREKVPGSCGQPGSESSFTGDAVLIKLAPSDQQGSAELSEDSRAAELQSVASLKVTIQQSSESREFGQMDRTADRQAGGLHCHVCNLTCRSVQMFQEHLAASEHLKKIKEITQSICHNTHTSQESRPPDVQRWCDTCQTHFSGDVIIHRRTKEHKVSKQLCRPFCPVCKRHFRTPRKFVEHMKSAEHKQQVQLEAQEEELIILDAVGCFEGEKEEEEEQEEEEEIEVAEEDDVAKEEAKEEESQEMDTQETENEEYDPQTTYGSSFVIPVSGFLCQLCNKFFYRESTARHTHCRTHTHFANLQSHRAESKHREKDKSALT